MKGINFLHTELGHPLKKAIGRTMGHHLTGTFKPCEDWDLGKAKKSEVSKEAVACSKILGKRPVLQCQFFFSLPLLKVRNTGYW